MIRLLELRNGAAHIVLPPERDPTAWHQALIAEIAAHLTPAHAALLAMPVRGEAGTVWFAPGTALRHFGALDATDRNRLTAATGVILSDIRRLAESGAAPAVTAAWPALRTVPDLAHLFAVDGGPVVAGWGFAASAGGAGPLAALDDGMAWHARPRVPWRVYASALAALGALWLFAGLVLVPLSGVILPSPAICRAAPGQLALLLDTARVADRTNMLRAQLAQLQEDHGERALQCPIPREVVATPTPQRAQVCVGNWPIGRWIKILATAQGLAPEGIMLPADPALVVPSWTTYFTRVTPCGAFRQRQSISTRPGRLRDGRSVLLNSIVADGPDGAHLCYEYWDAYRKNGDSWVRDAVQLMAVVLRTPQGIAVAGTPTAYCTSPASSRP